MKTILCILTVAAFTGCASFKEELTLRETDPKTGIVTERTTRNKYTAFWDSKNTFDKTRTTNTQKTQSTGTTGFSDETTSTNVVNLGGELIGAAVKAFVKP